MAAKVRHECERCGAIADLERAGRFSDEDYRELLQDYFALERQFCWIAGKYQSAVERIDQLRELVNMLPDPVPDVDAQDEEEALPF